MMSSDVIGSSFLGNRNSIPSILGHHGIRDESFLRVLPGFKVEENILGMLLDDWRIELLPIAPVIIGHDVLLAGFAEFLSTFVIVLLMLQQVDVLLAVLALEVIAADVLAFMIPKTVFASERSTAIIAEFTAPRNTNVVAVVALRADVVAVVLLPLCISKVTVFAVKAAGQKPGHCGDEVIMIIVQQQIDFLLSGGLLFWRPCNNGMVVLREDFDLIILVENTLMWSMSAREYSKPCGR